ncbi:hypothetical protein BPOR_0494g00050 [Botrytis porri]|uniref:Uncharacterized protein n=1 Tax=Botrytis porri TaxID=87229 RepID=A0A4Z1KRF5_9HELO|nr:hypothetical protein BPOR_0494g00050 [Botrytis porri]
MQQNNLTIQVVHSSTGNDHNVKPESETRSVCIGDLAFSFRNGAIEMESLLICAVDNPAHDIMEARSLVSLIRLETNPTGSIYSRLGLETKPGRYESKILLVYLIAVFVRVSLGGGMKTLHSKKCIFAKKSTVGKAM